MGDWALWFVGYVVMLVFTAAASSETRADHGFVRPIYAGIFWPVALLFMLGIKFGKWVDR